MASEIGGVIGCTPQVDDVAKRGDVHLMRSMKPDPSGMSAAGICFAIAIRPSDPCHSSSFRFALRVDDTGLEEPPQA